MENDKTTSAVPTKEELQAFIQARSYYYIPKWESFDPTLKLVAPGKFNWAACFLNVFWMAYRRMYLFVIILVAFEAACFSILEFFFRLSTSVTNSVGIATMILLGRYGNSIYRKHVERKIRQIKAKMTPEYWSQAFRDSGGTSLWAPIPLIILQLLTLLGMFYGTNQGILQKNVKANVVANTSTVTQTADSEFDKYKKLAEDGNPEAQYKLGGCYDFGKGVAEDKAQAFNWYRKSADQNYAEAQWWLGYCYAMGWGGATKDAAEAVKWYQKAADQNYAPAQCRLGECYAQGQGVPKDDAEAVKWYQKAAEQNSDEAQYKLGTCYDFGMGVPEDAAEAVKWYIKAANQGDLFSEWFLGNDYKNGHGVAIDLVEAYKWLNLASAQGWTMATTDRDALAASMTPDQIAEAQRLSTEFQPQKKSASTNSN